MKQLGPYVLLDQLGGGRSSLVYRAQDSRYGRTVAVKVLRTDHNLEVLQRFQHEIAVLQHLSHPHIVATEAFEVLDDGRLLIVMPYLNGKTLDKFLIPLHWRDVLPVFEQVLLGLGYAHDRGVVHCDIKPANLVMVQGHIKILDFGLARWHQTLSEDSLVGTLEYMSPEAARGSMLDSRSDLWSLGVVAYELLTGQSPFKGPTLPMTLRNIVESNPRPIGELCHGLPHALETAVMRLLNKSADDRYASAAEVLHALSTDQQRSNGHWQEARDVNKTSPLDAPEQHDDQPVQLLGREDEIALLKLYLDDPECRLLTVHGIGGVGKTHLCTWVMTQLPFQHCQMVELVSVSEGGLLGAIASALAFEGMVTVEALQHHIGYREQLLILDNFEHLISQGPVLQALLSSCPQLKLLVTSRQRLALPEEWVMPLYGLHVPNNVPEPDLAHRYAALRLFAQYARKHDPDFSLVGNLASVCLLCQLVQGHPLSITIAAALCRQLPIDRLIVHLKEDLDALEFGVGRHRSLQVVVKASYELLEPRLRQLVTALAVFPGEFTEAAANRIAGATTHELERLLDASLLERSLTGRYFQHPVIHSYFATLLKQADDYPRLRRRFERYYRHSLTALGRQLRTASQSQAFHELQTDLINFLHAFSPPCRVTAKVAEPLRAFYTHKGRATEGRTVFQRFWGPYARACQAWFALLTGELGEALALGEPLLRSADTATRLLALNTCGGVWQRQSRLHEARDASIAARKLAEELGDTLMLAACNSNLAMLELRLGSRQTAITFYQQSLALAEQMGNYAQVLAVLNNLADVYLINGEFDAAKPLLQRALLLVDQVRLPRLKPLLQANFGLCLHAEGHYDYAEAAFTDSLKLLKDHDEAAIATRLSGMVQCAIKLNDLLSNMAWRQRSP